MRTDGTTNTATNTPSSTPTGPPDHQQQTTGYGTDTLEITTEWTETTQGHYATVNGYRNGDSTLLLTGTTNWTMLPISGCQLNIRQFV